MLHNHDIKSERCRLAAFINRIMFRFSGFGVSNNAPWKCAPLIPSGQLIPIITVCARNNEINARFNHGVIETNENPPQARVQVVYVAR
jgi:hypothetical protein